MTEQRQVTEDYLQYFIHCIREGCRVVYVQESNVLGVEDPNGNYIVVGLSDKVIVGEVYRGQDSNPSG